MKTLQWQQENLLRFALDFFVKELPELVGGSADLTPSNNTFSKSSTTFSNENPRVIILIMVLESLACLQL